jgi:cytochrome d ubiquinol oxidase subunit II
VTPIMLGVCAGAVLAGRIRVDPLTETLAGGFVRPWLAPFPFAVGAFALALCAFLAAIYLTVETRDLEVRRAFRRRALFAAFATGALAWLCLALAPSEAPAMHRGLWLRRGAIVFHLATAAAAIGAIALLWRERYLAARAFAVAQVALVVCGWGIAQYPALIVPDVTLWNAAAPRPVLHAVLWALAAGAIVLLPALAYLFRIFKREPQQPGTSEP